MPPVLSFGQSRHEIHIDREGNILCKFLVYFNVFVSSSQRTNNALDFINTTSNYYSSMA